MKLSSPTINKAALDATDASSLCTEARIEQALLAGDATGIKAANVSIEESVIERVLFIEARLEKLSLGDVELKACDLSAARCSESSLIRVRFNGGRMTGVDFSRSTLKDVVFEDCKLDMVNFRFVKLTRVKFINCVLNEADFQAAELKEVMFEGC
ncbi:MAG TPA: pentapeptide repeat-containing protein, partial [Candidatus Saccharimonadales bacterium]